MGAKARPLPSRKLLQELLRYESETGKLYWRERPEANAWNAKWAGKEAFTASSDGYRVGRIGDVLYRAHRVIWKMVTGQEPDEIDHDNGVRHDNRWLNLVDGTHQKNLQNQRMRSDNTTGTTGVYWYKANGKWMAQITVGQKRRFLGYFESKEAAVAARRKAERQNGYHPNHGLR